MRIFLRKNMTYISVIALLGITITVWFIFAFLKSAEQPKAKLGVLDLTGFSFTDTSTTTLSGEWKFYYRQFITKDAKNPTYIKVPGIWNSKTRPAIGYGTYYLTVTGVTPNKPLALRLSPQSTAYRLYIDGSLLAEHGRAATLHSQSVPNMNLQFVNFVPRDKTFQIAVHISNFERSGGGIWDDIVMGSPSAIWRFEGQAQNEELVYLGIIILMLFYFSCQLFLNSGRHERGDFNLLPICLIILVRLLGTNEYLILKYIPNLNFKVLVLMDYVTTVWAVTTFAYLLKKLYPNQIRKYIERLITIVAVILTVFCVAVPTYAFTKFSSIYQIFAACVMGYILFVLARAIKEKEQYAKTIFSAFLFLTLTVLYDILILSFIIPDILDGEKSVFGFIVFLFFQAFILAKEYVNAVEKQKTILEYASNAELKFLQSQIKPHFLYNALSAIANVCVKDSLQAEQLIMDLALFLRGSFDFTSFNKMTDLENELDFIKNYIHIEKARFGDRINYVERIEASLSVKLPRLIIEPLIENSVRHGISKKKEGGEVRLSVFEASDGINIEVWDNGVGFDRKKLAELLDEDAQNNGVGIKNIQARLLKLYGKGLTIESEPNIFTRVSFTIPKETDGENDISITDKWAIE